MNTSGHIVAALALAACFGSAQAAPLQGSGPNLPLPAPFGIVDDRVAPAITDGVGGFTGVWSSPVLTPWQGTFTATGPNPGIVAGQPGAATGVTRYDFSGLNAGLLRAGAAIALGDLDGGSGSGERFVLNAFDTGGVRITTPWLRRPEFAWGRGGGPGGSILATDMPGWSFVGGVYEFIGNTVPGNPTLSVSLGTFQDPRFLELERTSTNSAFGLLAPVPAPGAALVLAAGGLLAARRRR